MEGIRGLNLKWNVFLLLFCSFAMEIMARKKRRKKDPHQSLWSFFKTISVVYILIFVPLFLYFIYTFINDPKTPDVLKGLFRWLKETFSSKLLKERKKRKKKKGRAKKKIKKRKNKEMEQVEKEGLPFEDIDKVIKYA